MDDGESRARSRVVYGETLFVKIGGVRGGSFVSSSTRVTMNSVKRTWASRR